MIVIGRPFYRSLDGYPGEQSLYIGPLDARGGDFTQERFNEVLRKLGQAYLGVENLTFNQLRTALCSVSIAESIKLGMTMDDPVIADFAASILTSIQMMKGRYNIHRQAATQSRATHAKYKGQVDFKGGAYGILKEAMKRDREVEGGGTESDESRELQQIRLRIELLERENRAKERALDLVKREQEMRAKTGGAPQTQAGGSVTGETGDREACEKRKRMTCDTGDHDAGVKKKPATFETGGREADVDDYKYDAYEKFKPTGVRTKKGGIYVLPDGTREGLVFVLGETKAAYTRARARGRSDKIWKKMNSDTRQRNGHYGTVNKLREEDKEFKAGRWYEEVIAAPPGNIQKLFIQMIAKQQYNDRDDDDVDEKFIWEWWSK